MPANLPPQYFEIERRYRTARTKDEKIKLLRELLAVVPKHKGTEKLQAELKSKIARLKREEKEGKKKGARRESLFYPEREGAARAVLLGFPNTGKSSILSALTNAKPVVASYPFTTYLPCVGMMQYEDIQIQIIDMAPITDERIEYWQVELTRNADLSVIVLAKNMHTLLHQMDIILQKFGERQIEFSGTGLDETHIVGPVKKRAIVVVNKYELEDTKIETEEVRGLYRDRLPIVCISAKEGHGLQELRACIFKELEIIRVYTKTPGKPPDLEDPIILRKDSTIIEAAQYIHKDFVNLKFARVWGSTKFGGQRVDKEYILQDKDIVEFRL